MKTPEWEDELEAPESIKSRVETAIADLIDALAHYVGGPESAACACSVDLAKLYEDLEKLENR